MRSIRFWQMHKRGFVHRDIKPTNILVRRIAGRWVPKLADFGLARSFEERGGTITKTGEVMGSMPFMPQEQIRNFKRSRPNVDIYAMGVTLYYLLTAHYPLGFPTPFDPPLKTSFR